ncbi:MAG: glycosyltransferase [Amphritea sp.]
MCPPRIVFYVQYLLGIGHIRRSSLVVKALVSLGVQVDVVFGGMPVPNISFTGATVHQLMAIKSADTAFSGLVKADGSEFTDEDKKSRTTALLDLLEKIQPDVVVTETYPFGRRQMRFELLPLINWVSCQESPPVLVSSIRDILQRRSEQRELECIDLIEHYYQHVLVHGDPAFFPLENSFPRVQRIADKVNYTGYVCPAVAPKVNTEKQIVASIGGGSVGKEILATVLRLYQTGFAADYQWLLITGPNMDAADKAYFMAHSDERLTVVELADDFLMALSNAYVSVSMAGYNTVMDLLQTRVPAVVVPFEGEGETEQMARSEVLAKSGVMQLLRHNEMTPVTLQQAIERSVASNVSGPKIDSDGANKSAKLLYDWARQKRLSVDNV